MQFKVPQFIEHEAKIFGPLTFKQFIVVGSAGLISLILFFIFGDNFFLWLVVSGIIIGTSISLVFVQVEGITLIALIGKSIGFFTNPRIYIWKKKAFSTRFVSKKEEKKDNDILKKKKTTLKRSEGSKIKKLWSEIEVK